MVMNFQETNVTVTILDETRTGLETVQSQGTDIVIDQGVEVQEDHLPYGRLSIDLSTREPDSVHRGYRIRGKNFGLVVADYEKK